MIASLLDDVFVLASVEEIHRDAVPKPVWRAVVVVIKHAWLSLHGLICPVALLVLEELAQDGNDDGSALLLFSAGAQVRHLGIVRYERREEIPRFGPTLIYFLDNARS